MNETLECPAILDGSIAFAKDVRLEAQDPEPAETFEQARADALYEAAEEKNHEAEAFEVKP